MPLVPLIRLYRCDEDAKYTLTELADIMRVTLPNMTRILYRLEKRKILADAGRKPIFYMMNGKMMEDKVQSYQVNHVMLDKYIFDVNCYGKVLFDRSRQYVLGRWDLKITSKLDG